MLIIFLIFILSTIFLTFIFLNLKVTRRLSKEEKNLIYIKDKSLGDTVEEVYFKETFSRRVNLFVERQIVSNVINKAKPDSRERIARKIRKVYKNKKTHVAWEYERILTSTFTAIMLFGILIFFKYYLFAPLVAILAFLLMYKMFESSLDSQIQKIDWNNFIFLPDILMSLCMLYQVGAISNVFQGFKRILKIYPSHPLLDDIALAVKEADYNKDRYDVLNDLAKRVDFKEFTSFVSLIIESEKNNIPVVNTLTSYCYNISNKRKIAANTKIRKLPELMELVMFGAAVPLCFIYMVAPSMFLALEQMKGVGIF